jgi:hypothetical protein
MVLWDVTPCSLMDGYQCIGGIYCFYFQDRTQNIEEVGYSKKLVTIYKPAQRMIAVCNFAMTAPRTLNSR